MAELKIMCSTNIITDAVFNIKLISLPDECVVYESSIPANISITIPVCAKKYQLEIKNNAGFCPMGIVKCFDFTKQCKIGFNPVYCIAPKREKRLLRITLKDEYYENITPINGGITVWQKNTP